MYLENRKGVDSTSNRRYYLRLDPEDRNSKEREVTFLEAYRYCETKAGETATISGITKQWEKYVREADEKEEK
ncbi:MAG: hypothetical protein IKS76_01585 [Paludibacteraceae bacterium]|nr:hypothetical protein [Paludibacteraceae bacterium]